MDKRIVLKTFGAAVAVGVVLGASPSILAAAADFQRGLMGEVPGHAQLSAQAARPRLQNPLSAEEQHELMQGLLYVGKGQYADAVRILGKYAMLGDPDAQTLIGASYYFGKGAPLDRDEGVRWLRLAAAQGSAQGQESLSAAVNGSWARELSAQPDRANADDFREIVERYASENGGISINEYSALARMYAAERGLPDAPRAPMREYASSDRPSGYSSTYSEPGGLPSTVGSVNGNAPADDRTRLHSRVEQELHEPSRMSDYRYQNPQPLNVQTTQGTIVLTTAAPGGVYSGSNGRTYIDQGSGVTDAQTGQFIPK